MKNNLLALLENDLSVWRSRLNDFEGLEKMMVLLHIDRIEKSIEVYKREKQESENN